MSWRTAGPAISSPTPPGPTAGSTRASPPISKTASWRRIYGERRARQEAALSFDDMTTAFEEEGRPTRSPASTCRQGGDPTAAPPASSTTRARSSCARIEKIVGRERLGRLSALLFRPPRLPADDLGALPGRSPRQSDQGRPGAGGQAAARPAGSTSRACPPMSRGPTRPPSPMSTRRSPASPAAAPLDAMAWGDWTTAERLRFLNKLPRELAKARLDALERGFDLNDDRQQRGALRLARAGHRQPLRPRCAGARAVRHRPGRRKFVRPLITDPVPKTRLGPADRDADLCQSPAALSPDHHQGSGRSWD